jgi:phosphoglycolate phosphatase-like HAD superfamily hydrolase
MKEPQAELRNIKKEHDFLIAIDSDGCAFDTMEIKHKECFIPNIILHWQLQSVSKYTRAASEFVNLYSKWRGINRFPALTMTFDLLQEWPEVLQRRVKIPQVKSLRGWIARETKLGNPALKKEVESTGDAVLKQALIWSEAVNKTVGEVVFGVPPFPFVRESLEEISQWADVIVCSATPNEALKREWQEHDLIQFVKAIAGQEIGSKKEHIAMAAAGKYQNDKILMIGDAPGDYKAAKGNQAHFFPINPGKEEQSWERFFKEAARKFKDGSYAGGYEVQLVKDFENLLPEIPPWKR